MVKIRASRLILALAIVVVSALLLIGQTDAIALGRQVYAENCAACHGPNGEGGNPAAPLSTNAQGKYPAPPHDHSGHTWHHADGLLKEIIRDGSFSPDFVSEMPAFGEKLSEAQIDAVLAYIKTWWSEEQRVFQAQTSRVTPGQFELFAPTP